MTYIVSPQDVRDYLGITGLSNSQPARYADTMLYSHILAAQSFL
jgi:hypothetical protein